MKMSISYDSVAMTIIDEIFRFFIHVKTNLVNKTENLPEKEKISEVDKFVLQR